MTEHHPPHPVGTPSGSQVPIDDSYPFNLSRLHPSDSGYGDSPGSTNTSALRFGYETLHHDDEIPRRRVTPSSGDEVAFGLDDIVIEDDDVMDEEDDDVFMETEDFYDGPGGREARRDRHSSSENSIPIDIPISFRMPTTSGAVAIATPPRFYGSNMHSRPDESPSASSLIMSGALHSPGGWSVMATRFNSPADSLGSLWNPLSAVDTDSVPSTTSTSHPERRPRFFSEGSALSAGGVGAEEEPQAVGPPLRRDRSRSEPAIQNELHRFFGRELRRISDEFHQSYQTLHELDYLGGRNGGNGVQPSSYPGSNRRRRGSWWQRVIQFVSPPALDTLPSRPLSQNDDDDSSSPYSSQSSTTTVRTWQRQTSEVDIETSLDDVDGSVPQCASDSGILFQVGDMDDEEDSNSSLEH